MKTLVILFFLLSSSTFVLSFGFLSNEADVSNFKKYNMNSKRHLSNVQDLDDSGQSLTKLRSAIAEPCNSECNEKSLVLFPIYAKLLPKVQVDCAAAVTEAKREDSATEFNLGLLYKKTNNPDAKYQCFRDKKLIVEQELNNDLKDIHTNFDAQVFPSENPAGVLITLFPECEAAPSVYVAHNTKRGSDACLKEKVLPKFKTIALLALNLCKDVKPDFVKDIKLLHAGKASPVSADSDRSFIGAPASATTTATVTTVQDGVKACIEKYKKEVLAVTVNSKLPDFFFENIPSRGQTEGFAALSNLKTALPECQGEKANSDECKNNLYGKLPKYEKLISKLKEATNAQCLTSTGLTLSAGATELNVVNLYNKLHPTAGEAPACLKTLETTVIADLKTEANDRKAALQTDITTFYKGSPPAATCNDACQINVQKDLPKFRALSTLATGFCKVPSTVALNYEKMKALTVANFQEHTKCMNDQNTLAEKAPIRSALYIDEWKEDQLKTKLGLDSFQEKFKGTAPTCDDGCKGKALVEAPIYTKVLAKGKNTVADGGCGLPANTELAGVYDIVKGTANTEFKTCVNGLFTAAAKEESKDSFREDFFARSKSYISNNNLINCKAECLNDAAQMGVAAKLVSDFCGLSSESKSALLIPQNIKTPEIPKLGDNSDCFKEYIGLSKIEAIRNQFPKIESSKKGKNELNAGNLVFSAFISLIGLIFVLNA